MYERKRLYAYGFKCDTFWIITKYNCLISKQETIIGCIKPNVLQIHLSFEIVAFEYLCFISSKKVTNSKQMDKYQSVICVVFLFQLGLLIFKEVTEKNPPKIQTGNSTSVYSEHQKNSMQQSTASIIFFCLLSFHNCSLFTYSTFVPFSMLP